MESCSELFCNKLLHQRDVIFYLYDDVKFHFSEFDGVTSFLASKTYEIHLNASITVQVFGGISFRVMEENWQHPKDTLAFSFLVCKNRNGVLLKINLLPNISLVVGQWSVNISLALHAREISTSRMTVMGPLAFLSN